MRLATNRRQVKRVVIAARVQLKDTSCFEAVVLIGMGVETVGGVELDIVRGAV